MPQDFDKPFIVGNVPGLPGQLRMPPQELYRRLGHLLQSAQVPGEGPMTPDQMQWVGQASALISKFSDLSLLTEANNAINGLNSPNRDVSFQKLLQILYKALALAELLCPAGVQGSFIPAGSPHDAFEGVAKIFRMAKKEILIIDPYMNGSVLSDFCTSALEHVRLRLLTDEGTVRPDLKPAGERWKAQHSTRPVEIRFAPAGVLHDRAFIIDSAQAWTVTQSLKDLATRAPASIVRADDIAALKIAAYELIWSKAQQIV